MFWGRAWNWPFAVLAQLSWDPGAAQRWVHLGRDAPGQGCPWDGMPMGRDAGGKGCPWDGMPMGKDVPGKGRPREGTPQEGMPMGLCQPRVAVRLLSLTVPCPRGGVTQPGSTDTQRIPLLPYSRARHLVSMFSAAWESNHLHHGVALPWLAWGGRRNATGGDPQIRPHCLGSGTLLQR